MPRSKEQIRGLCEEKGFELVKEKFNEEPITFFKGSELGYAKEWLQDQEDKIKQSERQDIALTIAKEANEIAKDSSYASKVSAAAAVVSAIIALIAVLWDKI